MQRFPMRAVTLLALNDCEGSESAVADERRIFPDVFAFVAAAFRPAGFLSRLCLSHNSTSSRTAQLSHAARDLQFLSPFSERRSSNIHGAFCSGTSLHCLLT